MQVLVAWRITGAGLGRCAVLPEFPGPLSGYIKLHKEVMTESPLSGKAKELIALAISITARCEGCIAFHVHDAIDALDQFETKGTDV